MADVQTDYLARFSHSHEQIKPICLDSYCFDTPLERWRGVHKPRPPPTALLTQLHPYSTAVCDAGATSRSISVSGRFACATRRSTGAGHTGAADPGAVLPDRKDQARVFPLKTMSCSL